MSSAPTPPSCRVVAAMGGTFDPVHYGHLRVASEAAAALGVAEIRLIPAGEPVHRKPPSASRGQRLAMLRLAVADWPALQVDDRELRRPGPSYTLDTLESLRVEHPSASILWLVGADAFLGLPSWHNWQRLFELAHFVVLNRPGQALAEACIPDRLAWAAPRLLRSRDELLAAPAGGIFLLSVTPQPISASAVRERLAAGAPEAELASLLPPAVLAYIRTNRLYSR
ncbi:MAG: nicotinate-nucleotide adenylyltransferase [Casimicrobiaceae bacterium]|nr:nicotinate-nucleotide adenylyltransferase [Casimicrobiaceae bacterium]MCX8099195.1 nicotinate-nucleotide adenylyltransferase [Casimicrobiaceae bacterium]